MVCTADPTGLVPRLDRPVTSAAAEKRCRRRPKSSLPTRPGRPKSAPPGTCVPVPSAVPRPPVRAARGRRSPGNRRACCDRFWGGRGVSGPAGLAEVLDGAEGADRGIKEGQEVSDEDVVEKEGAVAVCGVLAAEPGDVLREHRDERGPLDRPGHSLSVAASAASGSGRRRDGGIGRDFFLALAMTESWSKGGPGASEDCVNFIPDVLGSASATPPLLTEEAMREVRRSSHWAKTSGVASSFDVNRLTCARSSFSFAR